MCSRKRLTFIKDFINNESVCHFMVVQLKYILFRICNTMRNGENQYADPNLRLFDYSPIGG